MNDKRRRRSISVGLSVTIESDRRGGQEHGGPARLRTLRAAAGRGPGRAGQVLTSRNAAKDYRVGV